MNDAAEVLYGNATEEMLPIGNKPPELSELLFTVKRCRQESDERWARVEQMVRRIGGEA